MREAEIELVEAVGAAAVAGSGALPDADRRAAFERGLGSGAPEPSDRALAALADAVAVDANLVGEHQVAQVAATHGDDAVYETVVATAAGAGIRRLRAGLRALGERP